MIASIRLWLVLTVVGTLTHTATAQETKPAAKKRAPNPVLASITDDPALPRVLLIGDSISMGYTLPVRELLKGKANVHRIPTNGGPTTRGVDSIDSWLGNTKWDVIHFNFGLHDLKYVRPGSTDLATPNTDGSVPQVSLADYEKNLETIVTRLEKTGAKLIWCTTTPVPEGSNGRVGGDEAPYNAAAAKVMKKHNVAVNDLGAHAAKKLNDVQLPKNVHFTPEGSKYLAEAVAAAIQDALPKK